MEVGERRELADALLAVSGVLVGISLRGVAGGDVDLTLAQHRVLVLLEEHGVLSVSEVAAQLGVNQSNASRHCSRLASLGLVVRDQAPGDARTVDLRLTAAGRRQVLSVRSARLRELVSVLGRVELPDARSAARTLRAFAEAADQGSTRAPAR
jgi:DNA-binding MarR family transcriptional regulator